MSMEEVKDNKKSRSSNLEKSMIEIIEKMVGYIDKQDAKEEKE